MNVFDELKARGLIAQITDEDAVKELFEKEKVRFYIGFDPTADSLHVGHFVQIMVMAHLQRAGHVPVALFGGGTGMIGDPSGRTDMRRMLTPEVIQHNVDCFVKQMSSLIDFSDGKALMVNNADWLMDLNYIDFIRSVGVHFSVNRMLAAECYKQRLEKGLTFFEMNYMLMQSYDFLYLAREKGVKMELGGDDQWSNIIGGVELNRRMDGREVYGMTFNLLLKSDGKKMGKTEGGAVWLDPEKMKPYDFYQYWRNVDDADVIKCLKMLTFVPLDEIEELSKFTGAELNPVKERLAFEVTRLIHGEAAATEAQQAARSVFSGADAGNMPSVKLSESDFIDGAVSLPRLIVAAGVAPSGGEARRLIQQGGVIFDGQKITDPKYLVKAADLAEGKVLQKGKKVFVKVIV